MDADSILMTTGLDLEVLVISSLAALIVVTIHGLTKALVSTKLGDPLPKSNGRLTLNPMKHVEPVGLFLMIFFGFGWGKTVDTAPLHYEDRKLGTILVGLMPFLVCLGTGIVFALFYGMVMKYIYILSINNSLSNAPAMQETWYFYIARFFMTISVFSLRHAFFNLIPIAPLDGARVLNCFLSPNTIIKKSGYDSILFFVLVMLLLWGIVGRVINPICNLIMSAVTAIIF